jgi:DNA-binding SARP family transcriptional activator
LYCDLNPPSTGAGVESETALWRVTLFRAARELAADYGGREASTAADGWVATFGSTIDALLCARALSSLVGWQTGGPGLSAGLSAGDVADDGFTISGHPVHEAIALCGRANPGQVLIADPLTVVVSPDTADRFAAAPLEALADPRSDPPGRRQIAPAPSGSPQARRQNRDAAGRYRRPRRLYRDRPAQIDQSGSEASLRLLRTSDQDPTGPASPRATPTRQIAGPHPDDSHPDDSHPDGPYPDGAGLRLTVLGWVTLEAGEPPVRRAIIRGAQVRTVLSLLALRRGPVHKDELAEVLWPITLPDHWDGALRGLITKSRRFLDAGGLSGRDALVSDGGYYELRLPPGVALDRDVATALIAAAEVALTDAHPAPAPTPARAPAAAAAAAAALARRAATILERRLLAGPDNAWFDQVRAELVRDRLTALELGARAELAAGAVESAKRAATEALEIDPYRESSYRLLMLAHASAGSRGEALRTYERCRRMLADNLGVGPAAQTQALYVELLG